MVTPWLDEPGARVEIRGLCRRHAYAVEALAGGLAGAFDWFSVRRALEMTVAPEELFQLGGAVLLALDDEAFAVLVEAAAYGEWPQPPVFGTASTEADEWAYFASDADRKRYLMACWRRLSRPDQARFLRAAQRVLLEDAV